MVRDGRSATMDEWGEEGRGEGREREGEGRDGIGVEGKKEGRREKKKENEPERIRPEQCKRALELGRRSRLQNRGGSIRIYG